MDQGLVMVSKSLIIEILYSTNKRIEELTCECGLSYQVHF